MQPSAIDGNFCWTETDPMLAMGASDRLKLILCLAMVREGRCCSLMEFTVLCWCKASLMESLLVQAVMLQWKPRTVEEERPECCENEDLASSSVACSEN
ncbi:hypothetical protein D5086_006213 [Populus alba]|uniref:Uncharacterized protein n=1 Tax=Populus alba TaxID=43335 RepID=A0ACC4CJV1_POPAL